MTPSRSDSSNSEVPSGPQHYEVRGFRFWVSHRGHSTGLDVPVRPRPDPAALDDDSRWKILHQCLTDTELPADVRVAVPYLYLYGQEVIRIAALPTDAVTARNDKPDLLLDRVPIRLPDLLGRLLTDFAARPRPRAGQHTTRTPGSLLPPSEPGRPITGAALVRRGRQRSVECRPRRGRDRPQVDRRTSGLSTDATRSGCAGWLTGSSREHRHLPTHQNAVRPGGVPEGPKTGRHDPQKHWGGGTGLVVRLLEPAHGVCRLRDVTTPDLVGGGPRLGCQDQVLQLTDHPQDVRSVAGGAFRELGLEPEALQSAFEDGHSLRIRMVRELVEQDVANSTVWQASCPAPAASATGVSWPPTAPLIRSGPSPSVLQGRQGPARSEGSGLGLAIAQENARLHGGLIEAANSPSGGAVFTLVLPHGLAPKEGSARAAPATPCRIVSIIR